MDKKPDLILEDIERTRTQLGEEISTLEQKVEHKISAAKESVEKNFENVKQRINEFTPANQLKRHPLVFFGGAALSGAILGTWIGNRLPEAQEWVRSTGPRGLGLEDEEKIPVSVPMTSEYEELGRQTDRSASAGQRFNPRNAEKGAWARFSDFFGDEIHMVRNMLLTSAFKRVRDVTEDAFPKVRSQIEKISNQALKKVEAAA